MSQNLPAKTKPPITKIDTSGYNCHVEAYVVPKDPDGEDDGTINWAGTVSFDRHIIYNAAMDIIVSRFSTNILENTELELSDEAVEDLEDCVINGFRARNALLGRRVTSKSSQTEFGSRRTQERNFSRPRPYGLTVRHPTFDEDHGEVKYVLEEAIISGPSSRSMVLDDLQKEVFSFVLSFVRPLTWLEFRQKRGYVKMSIPLERVASLYFDTDVGNHDVADFIDTQLRIKAITS